MLHNIVKLAMIHYTLLFAASHLVSSTSSSLNDVEFYALELMANWDVEVEDEENGLSWDQSSLKFVAGGDEWDEDGHLRIFGVVMNGDDSKPMQGVVNYELFFAEKGNAKSGTIIESGEIPALAPGETFTLYHKPTASGNYKFKAYQRPGHPGKGELWGDGTDGVVVNTSGLEVDQNQGLTQEPSDDVNDVPIDETNSESTQPPDDKANGDLTNTLDEEANGESSSSTDGEANEASTHPSGNEPSDIPTDVPADTPTESDEESTKNDVEVGEPDVSSINDGDEDMERIEFNVE